MNTIRGLAAFFFALAFLGSAHAETIAATSSQSYSCAISGGTTQYDSVTGNACKKAYDTHPLYGAGPYVCPTYSLSTGACYKPGNGYVGGQTGSGVYNIKQDTYCLSPTCINGKTYGQVVYADQPANIATWATLAGTVYSCPSNGGWTLSGQTCTRTDCVGIEVRNASGVCEVPACPAGQSHGPTGSGTCKPQCTSGAKTADTGQQKCGVGACPSNFIGSDGCEVESSTCVGIGGNFCAWAGRATGNASADAYPMTGGNGASLAPPSIAASPDQIQCSQAGQCLQVSQGVSSCVQCETAKTWQTTKTTAADNTVTKTTTVTDLSITGGSVGAVKTTTTDVTPSGGPTTSSTTSQSSDTTAPAFCLQNPASPICKPSDECLANPDRVGCSKLGTAEAVADLTTQQKGIDSITPISMGGNAVCPADVLLPKGAVFTWQPVCDFASGLRPIILAVAWLGAGLIVLGGLRNG